MLTFRFLALVGLLCAHLCASAGACDANLVTDRYYGVVVIALEKGILTTEDLVQIVASNAPTNPLANETPGSRNSAALHSLAAMVQDTTVRELWPLTRERLRAVLGRRTGEAEVVNVAKEKTSLLVAPTVVLEIAHTIKSVYLTTLADGTAVAVHFFDGKELRVTRLTDGKLLYQAPIAGPPVEQAKFGRLEDGKGGARLLIVNSHLSANPNYWFLNLNKLELIQAGEWRKVFGIHEATPDTLLVEIQVDGQWAYHRVDASSTVHRLDREHDNTYDYLFTSEGQIRADDSLRANVDRIFRISGKRRVQTHVDEFKNEFYVDIEGEARKTLHFPKFYRDRGLGREVSVGEMRDGNIWLALSQHKPTANDDALISFYNVSGGPEPVYQAEYKARSISRLRWFQDHEGDLRVTATLLPPADGPFQFIYMDPISKFASNPFVLGNGPNQWLHVGSQYYFFVHRDETAKVYSVINSPR